MELSELRMMDILMEEGGEHDSGRGARNIPVSTVNLLLLLHLLLCADSSFQWSENSSLRWATTLILHILTYAFVILTAPLSLFFVLRQVCFITPDIGYKIHPYLLCPSSRSQNMNELSYLVPPSTW